MENYTIKGTEPSIKSGIVYIDIFISSVHFLKLAAKPNIYKYLERIFKEQTPHLSDKFTFEDLSGFFLNLDNSNQLKFLSGIGFYERDLALPHIENWKEYGKKAGMNDWEDGFEMEDVRSVGEMFVNEWDLYPHALVWIRRFLLYANNNQISNPDYLGEKFGNYPNWSEYIMQLRMDKKQEFVQALISYK